MLNNLPESFELLRGIIDPAGRGYAPEKPFGKDGTPVRQGRNPALPNAYIMMVGNTVQETFGSLPEQDVLPASDNAIALTNAHVHLPPNFGSIPSVADAIRHAQEEQITILGASNYYDYTIYRPFAETAANAGIAPVFGIEVLTMDEGLRASDMLVNDPKNPGKFYICGKGLTLFDAIPENILPIWQQIRKGDTRRIEAMIAKINAIDLLKQHEIQLTYKDIAAAIAAEKQVAVETVFLQERHLAQAAQHAIFAAVPPEKLEAFLKQLYQVDGAVETQNVVKAQNELRTYLLKQGKIAYVDECYISPEEAATLITGLGGYVSYPILIDGAPAVSPFEGPAGVLAENLLKRQIGAVEYIPTRNALETLTDHAKTMREYGFVVGAGTEHNDAVWIPLLPACKQQTPLSEELIALFWEGACVAVAHQYLRAKGQEGFRFLPEKSERIALIEDMAELGVRIVKSLQKRRSLNS